MNCLLVHLRPSALFFLRTLSQLKTLNWQWLSMHPSSITLWKKSAIDDPWARSRSYTPYVSHAFQKIFGFGKRILSKKKKVSTVFHRLLIKNYIPVYSNQLISYWIFSSFTSYPPRHFDMVLDLQYTMLDTFSTYDFFQDTGTTFFFSLLVKSCNSLIRLFFFFNPSF